MPNYTTLTDAILRQAHVAFNAPEKVRIHKPFNLQAILSESLSPSQLSALIDQPGKVTVKQLRAGPRMQATLDGGVAFDISPSGPQSQWISQSEATEWDWEVVPKLSGQHELKLNVDVLLKLNGESDRRPVVALRQPIEVQVEWIDEVTDGLESVKKNGENIAWIGASAMAVGGFLWTRLRSKKPKQDGDGATPDAEPPSDKPSTEPTFGTGVAQPDAEQLPRDVADGKAPNLK